MSNNEVVGWLFLLVLFFWWRRRKKKKALVQTQANADTKLTPERQRRGKHDTVDRPEMSPSWRVIRRETREGHSVAGLGLKEETVRRGHVFDSPEANPREWLKRATKQKNLKRYKDGIACLLKAYELARDLNPNPISATEYARLPMYLQLDGQKIEARSALNHIGEYLQGIWGVTRHAEDREWVKEIEKFEKREARLFK